MSKIILSIDCGTQSVRAMLFNEHGELLGKCRETFQPYFSVADGYAEQSPELYWEKLCIATTRLSAEKPEEWKSIVGVALTVMRDVGICVDSDVKPLRPCILWMDRRLAKCEEKLPITSRLIFNLVGMRDTVEKNRRDCKCNWLAENEPDIWAKTDKYIQLSTYLTYKITGNVTDSVAQTIGHIPFDYKTKKWMSHGHYQRPCFRDYGESKQYPLLEPGEILGYVTAEVSKATAIHEGIPLIATGSDKGCETIGTGCIFPGIASVSFGTTATIQVTTDKYVEPITFLPPYPAVYPGKFNPEIMIWRGYWMITWFIREFMKKSENDDTYYEKQLDKLLPTIPAGCDGLYVEPAWGAGLKYPEERGAMVGFTETHTALHIYRAIIEGINYGLIAGKIGLEKKTKVPITKLMVSGGGAGSDEVCQITADMFGIPVARVQTYETSGLGAAICAFVGLGLFDTYDKAISAMVHEGKVFAPNAEVHNTYDRLYHRVFAKSFKSLRPIFRELKDFYRYK